MVVDVDPRGARPPARLRDHHAARPGRAARGTPAPGPQLRPGRPPSPGRAPLRGDRHPTGAIDHRSGSIVGLNPDPAGAAPSVHRGDHGDPAVSPADPLRGPPGAELPPAQRRRPMKYSEALRGGAGGATGRCSPEAARDRAGARRPVKRAKASHVLDAAALLWTARRVAARRCSGSRRTRSGTPRASGWRSSGSRRVFVRRSRRRPRRHRCSPMSWIVDCGAGQRDEFGLGGVRCHGSSALA